MMQRRVPRKSLLIFIMLLGTFSYNASASDMTETNAPLAIEAFEFIETQEENPENIEEIENWVQADQVVIEGLDKITARVFTAKVLINQLVRFGTLELFVRAAYRTPPTEAPDSACFIEIYDCKQGEQKEKVFSGWMFASNPALSALEHAVYDVWIKDTVLPEKIEEKS